MIRAFFLLLILWITPIGTGAAAQGDAMPPAATAPDTSGESPPGFAMDVVQSVYSTALAFISPRTLEPQSIPQLTLWGLHGLTALDPALNVELRETAMRLTYGDRLAYLSALPTDQTATAWAGLAARMALASMKVSDPVRQAGTEGVIRSFFDELFNHLDPYSRYAPPGAAETDRERRSGQAGLGLTVARRGASVVVQTVLQDSPAADQGIRPGDRIISVDGRRIGREDAATVDGWIAGPDGSTVSLGWRGRDNRLHTANIERALVPPETVTAQRLGELVLIRIDGFSVDTDQQFSDALAASFSGHRVRGLIIDLRGNRGGLLRQAVAAVDMVLVGGIVTNTAGRHPQSSREWKGGDGPDQAQGRPIVVLVDGRTASAAEIMAAAMEDAGRAVVVGSSTLGKGLVQTIEQLPNGGELFVTWSRVLAPGGWPIQGLGVMPQVCTSLGEDTLKAALEDLAHGQQDMAVALARHNAARAPIPVAQIVELRNACPAAEGRDLDVDVGRFLLDNPAAYTAATATSAVRSQ